MKIQLALSVLALSLAAGCGGSGASTPSVAGLPIALACTTTGGLPGAPGQTWRVQVSTAGPDDRRALMLTRGDTFPHAGVSATPPISFTARAVSDRFDVGVVRLSFEGGEIEVLGFEGAEGAMWTGTANIRTDRNLAMSCWDPQWKPAYHYADGACVDGNGVSGINWMLPGMARELKSGECSRLTGSLSEGDGSQPQLVGWNLAGADLTTATLFLADLPGADLRGADLTGFQYGYASLSATIDAHTTGIPSIGCTASSTQLDCQD